MAKINRYNGDLQAFAINALTDERYKFGDTTSSDDLTDNINADFLRGWFAKVSGSTKPPEQWFNAVVFVSTQLCAYLHQIGIPEYNASQVYYTNSYCNYNGVPYKSLVDDNTGNQPDISASEWASIYHDAPLTGTPTAPTPTAGDNSTKIATTAFVQSSAVPSGMIMDYAGTSVPSGWLECDGSAVSRTTYAGIFAAIGTTWGSGDGATTFNLPVSARRAVVGRGGTATATLGNTVGSIGGAETHAQSTGELAGHEHDVSNGHSVAGGGSYVALVEEAGSGWQTASTGGGSPMNIMSPAMVGLRCIKI